MGSSVVVALGFEERERTVVGEIYWQAFGSKMRAAFPSEAQAQSIVSASLNPSRVFVAREGHNIVGICGIHWDGQGSYVLNVARASEELSSWQRRRVMLLTRPLKTKAPHGALALDAVAVAANQQGKGVGTALLEHAEDFASKQGITEVYLDVIDSNPRAQSLYERVGYVAVKTHSVGFMSRWWGFSKFTVMVKKL